MTATTALAVLAGAALGVGLWIVFIRLPVMRQTTFSERVAPQLRAVDPSSRLLRSHSDALASFGPLGRIAGPLLKEAAGRISRLNVGSAAVERRLLEAGSKKTAVEFRAERLVWAGLGFGVSTLGAVAASLSGRASPAAAALVVLVGTMAGSFGRDYVLASAIRKRKQRILSEFPAVADMMALAVAAGETAAGALDRTARISRGAIAEEFALLLADTWAGTPFVDALRRMAARIRLAPITRFVNGLAVALERGTPLADVLRAQAQDVRDVAKRELMEAAGRKEIAMMVPLVFGILPLTLLFAVFPGLAVLTLYP